MEPWPHDRGSWISCQDWKEEKQLDKLGRPKKNTATIQPNNRLNCLHYLWFRTFFPSRHGSCINCCYLFWLLQTFFLKLDREKVHHPYPLVYAFVGPILQWLISLSNHFMCDISGRYKTVLIILIFEDIEGGAMSKETIGLLANVTKYWKTFSARQKLSPVFRITPILTTVSSFSHNTLPPQP